MDTMSNILSILFIVTGLTHAQTGFLSDYDYARALNKSLKNSEQLMANSSSQTIVASTVMLTLHPDPFINVNKRTDQLADFLTTITAKWNTTAPGDSEPSEKPVASITNILSGKYNWSAFSHGSELPDVGIPLTTTTTESVYAAWPPSRPATLYNILTWPKKANVTRVVRSTGIECLSKKNKRFGGATTGLLAVAAPHITDFFGKLIKPLIQRTAERP